MTEEMRKKMLEKVRKLLALSASANENEAALAAAKAQTLLAEYNLTLSEVKALDRDEEDEDVGQGVAGVTNSKPWRRPLAQAVGQMFFCKYFFQAVGKKEQHVYIGSKTNIQVATMMFEYLHTTVHKLSWQECTVVPKEEQPRFRTSFRVAASTRLCHRIRERIAAAKAGQVKTEGGTNLPALMSLYLQWDNRNDAFIEKEVGKLKTSRSLMRPSHAAGYRAGRAAGDKIGLDQQVGGRKSAGLLK